MHAPLKESIAFTVMESDTRDCQSSVIFRARPAVRQSSVVREPFDFSCAVVLPDGTPADVQQTDIQRSVREDRTFFVAVRPHNEQTVFMGALNFSGSSLRNLEACPGDTRADKARWVAGALQKWVKAHGLSPDFTLDLTIDADDDHRCCVAITVH